MAVRHPASGTPYRQGRKQRVVQNATSPAAKVREASPLDVETHWLKRCHNLPYTQAIPWSKNSKLYIHKMSRALWQSRRPIYGKFAHVVDLTVKYRNSMQGHQAKKAETTIQQLLPSSVIQNSESFPSLSVNLMYCEKVQILSLKKQELIPSDMTCDFIYANILRLGFEKEHEVNTLVHQLFVHKNCFLPLVHKHLYNPLYIIAWIAYWLHCIGPPWLFIPAHLVPSAAPGYQGDSGQHSKGDAYHRATTLQCKVEVGEIKGKIIHIPDAQCMAYLPTFG